MSATPALSFRVKLYIATFLLAALPLAIPSLLAAPVPIALQPWLQLLHGNATQRENAIDSIGIDWSPESAARAIEVLRFLQPSRESMLMMKTGFTEADDWGDWLR